MKLDLWPMVPDVPLPYRAGAATRDRVPPGYGVQEQCLPFTAACALGLLIPAPFSFGLCLLPEVPPDGRAFLPPEAARPKGDERHFYVIDEARSRFRGNCFDADAIPFVDAQGAQQWLRPQLPGLSFMERPDQAEYFKVHLPWVLRTPVDVDACFAAPINRPAPLQLMVGLVESDWYAHPVNLVARRPDTGALHVRAGDVIAQVFLVERDARRVDVQLMPRGSELAREQQSALLAWYQAHHQDRSAYRRMARSRQGRVALGESGIASAEDASGDPPAAPSRTSSAS